MRNSILWNLIMYFILLVFVSCKKTDPAWLLPPPVPDQSFVEEFDTVAAAFQRGWIPVNTSNPKGSGIWTQGGGLLPLFAPYSSRGTYAGFIAADYLSTSAEKGVISNWLISPLVWMKNGDQISFYTRTHLYPLAGGDSTDFGNNLEVCLNRKDESANVGIANDPRTSQYDPLADRGDFDLLLSINPPSYDTANNLFVYRNAHSLSSLYDPLAFPYRWTKFIVTVDGLTKPKKCRFAFRYYTLDAGSNGNGSAVAIDQVTFKSIN